jgi:hypothetical protein
MPKIKRTNTDPAVFEVFKKEFVRLAELFGLSDWSYSFYFQPLLASAARLNYDVVERWAKVCLNSTCPETRPVTEADAKKSAAHEFAHLFTGDLLHAAITIGKTQQDVDAIAEIIARRFEYATTKGL